MAITLDQINAVINVPIADLTFVSAGVYTFDTDTFRQTLRQLEDDEENSVYPITHNHIQPITVGGVALARVIEILPHWEVTFEDGLYRVTLEGSNNNILDVATVNQVSIASTNSAGLTYSSAIEDQSYTDGRVFVDPVNGTAGQIYPKGTTTSPVNSFTDAVAIISSRSLPSGIRLNGTITLTTEDISDYNFLGGAATHDIINLGTATTDGAVFDCIKLQGTNNGVIHCQDCILAGVSDFEGFLVGGAIGGTLTLAGETHLVNAHAAATGSNFITIDYQGNAISSFIPGWDGSMHIINHSNAGALTAIDMNSGKITLESTCTDGVIVIRGPGNVIDNSGVGCTVITDATTEVLIRG